MTLVWHPSLALEPANKLPSPLKPPKADKYCHSHWAMCYKWWIWTLWTSPPRCLRLHKSRDMVCSSLYTALKHNPRQIWNNFSYFWSSIEGFADLKGSKGWRLFSQRGKTVDSLGNAEWWMKVLKWGVSLVHVPLDIDKPHQHNYSLRSHFFCPSYCKSSSKGKRLGTPCLGNTSYIYRSPESCNVEHTHPHCLMPRCWTRL